MQYTVFCAGNIWQEDERQSGNWQEISSIGMGWFGSFGNDHVFLLNRKIDQQVMNKLRH